MTINLEATQVASPETDECLSEASPGEWEGQFLSEKELADIESVARALDRMRRVCEQAGAATLRAEVLGVPAELICAALDQISMTAERVIGRYIEP